MKRFATMVLTAGLLVGMGACSTGDNPTGPGGVDVLSGTFNLSTVDGHPAPYTFPDGNVINTYTIVLRTDATFHLTITTGGPGGDINKVSDGTYVYSRSAGTLVMDGQPLGVLHAAVSGAEGTLTLDQNDSGGYVVVLKK